MSQKTQTRQVKTGNLYRSATFDKSAIDLEARTVALTFSSETQEVERSFGVEVLSHDAGAVDLSRLQNGAPSLFNHNPDAHIGTIEAASIDVANKVGRATVRFGTSQLAEEKFKDVQDGILTKVSVGYRTNEAIDSGIQNENGLPVIRITKWMPFEISLVTIPADDSVGVGRSIEEETNLSIRSEGGTKERQAQPEALAGNSSAINRSTNNDKNIEVVKMENVESIKPGEERKRVTEIMERAKRYAAQVPEAYELAQKAVGDGTDYRSFGDDLLSKIQSQPIQAKDSLGMSKKEARSYNLMNVVNALSEGRPLDGVEREAHDELVKRGLGKRNGAYCVPCDALNLRASNITKASGGAALVGTEHRPQDFVDLLYAQSALGALNVPFIRGLSGDIDIPKLTTGTTGYWVAEDASPTASVPVTGSLNLSPATVAASVTMSRKLMKQSSPYVQDILMNDVLRAIADQVDKKFFAGTGASGMPKGIDQAITDASTAAVSSATTITWPLVQQFITTLQTLNVYGGDLSNIKWVLPPAMAAIVKGKTRDAGSGFYFMDQGGTMAGHDSFISPNATTGRIYLANWTDVMLAGEWGNLEIGITDDPANFNSGAKIIRCFYDVNFGARRPSAIAYASTFTA